MALTLMYITNQPEVAKIAQDAGVDRIFVDLEIVGKMERQGHLNTVISKHVIEDVSRIKQVLTCSELLVRVNPIYEGSKQEIDEVIRRGADIVMLPMFKTRQEVEQFVEYVGGRVTTCALLETKEAVENLQDILGVKGVDEIHIGLNDLHLSYKKKFMFEVLSEGLVEDLCGAIAERDIPYGFGGIARLGQGMLPAEYIITEHYRLGSTRVILGRSFCDPNNKDIRDIRSIFENEVVKIRQHEERIENYSEEQMVESMKKLRLLVEEIVKAKQS